MNKLKTDDLFNKIPKKISVVNVLCSCKNTFFLFLCVDSKIFKVKEGKIYYKTIVCFKCNKFTTGKEKLISYNSLIDKVLKSKKDIK